MSQTVPSVGVTTLPPVPLTRPASVGGSVVVRIDGVRSVKAVTKYPGEVGGASVAVTVTVRNGSSKAVDVGDVVVTALDSTGAPGGIVSAAPTDPFRGTVAAGKSAEATYTFSMSPSKRQPITVTVSLEAGRPVASFKGDVD